jgi:hypothetical protein
MTLIKAEYLFRQRYNNVDLDVAVAAKKIKDSVDST